METLRKIFPPSQSFESPFEILGRRLGGRLFLYPLRCYGGSLKLKLTENR